MFLHANFCNQFFFIFFFCLPFPRLCFAEIAVRRWRRISSLTQEAFPWFPDILLYRLLSPILLFRAPPYWPAPSTVIFSPRIACRQFSSALFVNTLSVWNAKIYLFAFNGSGCILSHRPERFSVCSTNIYFHVNSERFQFAHVLKSLFFSWKINSKNFKNRFLFVLKTDENRRNKKLWNVAYHDSLYIGRTK